jgi:hypothetical protein
MFLVARSVNAIPPNINVNILARHAALFNWASIQNNNNNNKTPKHLAFN